MSYVYRDGEWRDKRTGEVMVVPDRICAPLITSDIPDYHSPVTGELISGRRARREDLKKNDCIEIDPPAKPRGFKNPRFAKKYGLPLNEA